MYKCVYTYIYIYASFVYHICTYMYTYIYIYVYICYIYVHMCLYICIYIYIYVLAFMLVCALQRPAKFQRRHIFVAHSLRKQKQIFAGYRLCRRPLRPEAWMLGCLDSINLRAQKGGEGSGSGGLWPRIAMGLPRDLAELWPL